MRFLSNIKGTVAGLMVAGAVIIGGNGSAVASELGYSEDFTSRLPTELTDAFNVQIKHELDGAQVYLALSAIFYEKNLDGFGHWFTQQYYEELNHTRLLMDFLKRKNAKVELGVTDAPDKLDSEEISYLFEKSLLLEQTQTNRINDLHDKAVAVGARDAATYLQWFIDEQVQEEDRFQNVIDRLKLVQNSLEGILIIEKELGLRPVATVWAAGQPLPPH